MIIFWYFEIQTDHLIPARKSDKVIINEKKKKKRTCCVVDFAILADLSVMTKEKEKWDKYLDHDRK